MPGGGADLPDAGVGITPVLTDEVGDAREVPAGAGVEGVALADIHEGRVEQLAVRVELHLAGRAVADPHRPRAAIALERQRALGRVRAAVETIEHLQPRQRQSRRVHEPPEERRRLGVTAQLQQRLQGERGVANPAVAVVPVPLAADTLGQRRGRRRRDRSRLREHEQLQRERGPQDRGAPGAGVAQPSRPVVPECRRGVQPRLDVAPRREHERLAVCRDQRQHRPATVRDVETPGDGALLQGRAAGVPRADRERVAAVHGDGPCPPRHEPRRRRGVTEARLDPPAQGHPAGQAFDTSGELANRAQSDPGKRHRIGHAHGSARGHERGLKHVGPGQVPAPRVERDVGAQLEIATAVGVEEGGEDAGRVEVRQAQPVDATIARDQRDGSAIADHGIVPDRRVAAAGHARVSSSPTASGEPPACAARSSDLRSSG